MSSCPCHYFCLLEVRYLVISSCRISTLPPFQTYDPTIEDAYRKQLVVDNQMCFVEVIDTAGQGMSTKFQLYQFHSWVPFSFVCHRGVCHLARSVGPVSIFPINSQARISEICTIFFSEGQGFILVYSITSRSTFERLEIFRQSMKRVKRQDPIFILVGNKCDKVSERKVSREEGAALAHQFRCEFIETSAKTAQNVECLFMSLIRSLRQSKNMELGRQARIGKKKSKCVVM